MIAIPKEEQKERSYRGPIGRLVKMYEDGKLTTMLIFLPPALLLFTIFVIWPILNSANYSMYKWSGYGELTNYIGLDNFKRLAGHRVFHQSVWNSLKLIIVSLCLQIPLALSMALLIYKKTTVNTAFRLIFFAPYILAEVATGIIWSFIFDGDYGISAQITNYLGAEPFFILANRQYAFYTIITVIIWKYFGYHMMIFIAALQAVPADLIEAAEIDGASAWKTVWHVKLPLISHAIKLSVFFAIVGALQVFDIIIPLTNGGPSNSTHSIVSYLYYFGMAQMNIGYGGAVGVVLFILCIGSAFGYKRWAIGKGASI